MEIVAPLITGLFLLYADKQSRKKLGKNIHGEYTLKLNGGYKWLGMICCLIGSFLLNAAISHWNEDIFLMVSLAVSMFLGMGLFALIWYYNYEIVFDDKRIKSTSWKNVKRNISWSEIESIKFNAISGHLLLHTKTAKIMVFQHSRGFAEFLRMMELNTKFRIEELKIPL